MSDLMLDNNESYRIEIKNSCMWMCNNCKNILPRGKTQKYCDNCGALLVLGETNEVVSRPKYKLRSDNAFTYVEEESDEKV